MAKRYVRCAIAAAILFSVAAFSYADDVPVYDVDNYPPQFDGQSDAGPAETGATVTPQPSYAPAPAPAAPAPSSLSSSPDQRLSRVEQQVNHMQSANLTPKVDALQSDIQSLRGQVEQLTRQLQQLQAQQHSQYADLDKRLSAAPVNVNNAPPAPKAKAVVAKNPEPTDADIIETPPVVPIKTKTIAAAAPAPKAPAVPSPNAVEQPNVAEEQQIYQTAYDLIKAKKYNEAIAALQKMLQKYPTGQFAANAHYWLGELYSLLGKNDQAAVEFASVAKNFPDSPKVSDAQLKLGLIYAGQFKWNDAKTAFKKVINHYPGTSSARLASEQLKQIKSAGH